MLSKIITTSEKFDGLQKSWEDLEKQDHDVTYYSTYAYIRAWWNEYGQDEDKELFIVCIMQDAEIVGIAPLYIQKKKRGLWTWNELRFLGKGDYSSILIQRKSINQMTILKSIFSVIEENESRWDRLKLSYIEGRSSLAHYLFTTPKYNLRFRLLVEVPRLSLSKFDSFENLEKTFPKKISKLRNKLKKEVGYEFKVISSVDEELYQKIREIHIKEQSYLISKKDRHERRSLFKNERIDRFRKSTVCYSPHTTAFLLESTTGKLLSYNLVYSHKDVLYSWNSAYDPEYEKYRLTKIRYYELFRYLSENEPDKIFDFGAGRYPWKFEWTDEFSSVYELDLWKSTSVKMKFLEKLHKMKK